MLCAEDGLCTQGGWVLCCPWGQAQELGSGWVTRGAPRGAVGCPVPGWGAGASPCWSLGAAVGAQLQLAPGHVFGTSLHSGGDMGRVTVPFLNGFASSPLPALWVLVCLCLWSVWVLLRSNELLFQPPVPPAQGQLWGPTDELCCFGAGSNLREYGFLPLTVVLGNLLGLL